MIDMKISKNVLLCLSAGAAALVAVNSLPLEQETGQSITSDIDIRPPGSASSTNLNIRSSGDMSLYKRNSDRVQIYTASLVAGVTHSLAGCTSGAIAAAFGGPAGAVSWCHT